MKVIWLGTHVILLQNAFLREGILSRLMMNMEMVFATLMELESTQCLTNRNPRRMADTLMMQIAGLWALVQRVRLLWWEIFNDFIFINFISYYVHFRFADTNSCLYQRFYLIAHKNPTESPTNPPVRSHALIEMSVSISIIFWS